MAANTVSKSEINLEGQTLNNQDSSGTEVDQPTGGRRRSPTLLKLQWLAERLRKVERIKKEVAAGTYRADSRDVAKALLNLQESTPEELALEEDLFRSAKGK